MNHLLSNCLKESNTLRFPEFSHYHFLYLFAVHFFSRSALFPTLLIPYSPMSYVEDLDRKDAAKKKKPVKRWKNFATIPSIRILHCA